MTRSEAVSRGMREHWSYASVRADRKAGAKRRRHLRRVQGIVDNLEERAKAPHTDHTYCAPGSHERAQANLERYRAELQQLLKEQEEA